MVVGFGTLIYIGLFGHQVINITPSITWTVWWAGLIVLVLFGGKVWCVMCPWDLIAVLLGPILLYLGFCAIARLLATWVPAEKSAVMKNVGVGKIFIQFSYSVLPIALFYHVAHNGMHLFMEGQNVLTFLSDPMGRGWDLFGTATKTYPPILGKDTIWVLQVLLVLTGHVFGIIVSQKTALKLFGRGRLSTLVLIPLLVAMICFSFVSLWLMHLDMNMRGTLM
jgi:hypothetical protein